MEDKKVNIVLFGPPGAGKGTQSDILAKKLNLFKISTGDLLREQIKSGSKIGLKIKSIINKGSLVSDSIIDKLISNIVSNQLYNNRLIFDGYPRNLNQAKKLDTLIKKNKQKLHCVFSLKVDEDTIIKRILGRQICTKCGSIFNEFFKKSAKSNHSCGQEFLKKRSDDNEKTLRNRFKTYYSEKAPILDYYKKQNLFIEIDGMQKIEEIHSKIHQIIQTMKT